MVTRCGVDKSLAVVVDSRNNTVVFWRVAPSDEIEDILDEAAEKFKSPPSEEPETDLKDDLWVEDEVYDYMLIPLSEADTVDSVFMTNGWKRSGE